MSSFLRKKHKLAINRKKEWIDTLVNGTNKRLLRLTSETETSHVSVTRIIKAIGKL